MTLGAFATVILFSRGAPPESRYHLNSDIRTGHGSEAVVRGMRNSVMLPPAATLAPAVTG